jgi:hypothetical protein
MKLDRPKTQENPRRHHTALCICIESLDFFRFQALSLTCIWVAGFLQLSEVLCRLPWRDKAIVSTNLVLRVTQVENSLVCFLF